MLCSKGVKIARRSTPHRGQICTPVHRHAGYNGTSLGERPHEAIVQTKAERRYERKEQPLPQLGEHVATLDAMLVTNAKVSKREKLTYRRLYEELRGAGYTGGYDAVRRYARAWAEREGERTAVAFVPLIFAPAEAYQFDWSHEIVVIDGVTLTVKVARPSSRSRQCQHCRWQHERVHRHRTR